jgi:hypothetical protein
VDNPVDGVEHAAEDVNSLLASLWTEKKFSRPNLL